MAGVDVWYTDGSSEMSCPGWGAMERSWITGLRPKYENPLKGIGALGVPPQLKDHMRHRHNQM